MEKSAYNEDNYLDGNPFYIRFFEETKEANLRQWDREQKEFSKALSLYDEYITRIASFIKHLGYKSSIDCMMTLSHLINCGYISNNLTFTADSPKEEITCSMGTSILRGTGCCRNFSQMNQEVFEKLALETVKFYCYQGNNAFNRAKNAYANHVINLVKYDGNVYGLDSYNRDRLFHFIDSYTLREINPNGGYNLRYKPYYELIQNESTLESIKERLARFEEYSKRKTISPFDFHDEIRFETKRHLREKEDDMLTFHQETEELRKSIISEMEEVFSRKR